MDYDEDDDLMDEELFQTILKSFVAETREAVETASERLLALEQDPDNQVVFQEIFRIFHNVKGNAKAVGFMELSDFAHKIESLLGQVRDSKIQLSQDLMDILLASNDAIGDGLEKSLNDENVDSLFDPIVKQIAKYN